MFYYDNQQLGKKLEEEFQARFRSFNGYAGKIHWASENQDYYEGTDFTCENLPFDLSAAFDLGKEIFLKEKMWYGKGQKNATKVVESATTDIYIGIRYGNRHNDFQIPVIVVGTFCTWASVELVAQVIVNNWKSIVDSAFDLWCEYDNRKEDTCNETRK